MHSTTPMRCCMVLLAAVLLSACASAPPEKPDDALSKAQYAINQAEQVVGRKSQSVPLYEAKQRLAKAHSLATEPKNYLKARRLAEEATLDARLAQSQAEARQAQAQKADLQESLETLREEIQQGGGGQ
ncbi:MAG: DUF4398 domain-containing protein [Nitrococcus mobilis]|nr:DUF4398 domain-containing protein [Nitrococcus mobilis]